MAYGYRRRARNEAQQVPFAFAAPRRGPQRAGQAFRRRHARGPGMVARILAKRARAMSRRRPVRATVLATSPSGIRYARTTWVDPVTGVERKGPRRRRRAASTRRRSSSRRAGRDRRGRFVSGRRRSGGRRRSDYRAAWGGRRRTDRRRARGRRTGRRRNVGRYGRFGRMPVSLARYWYRKKGPSRKWRREKRRRYGRGGYPRGYRSRRRAASRRGGKHLRAVRTIRRGQMIAGLVRRNPRTGRYEMRYATVANPRRRYSRRRRNPGGASGFVSGIKHTAKGIVAPTLAGGVGGVLAGLLDGKLGNKGPVISSLAKLGMGVAGATLLRKNAHAAYAFFGATVGSIGYPVGVKISGSGGVVAATKAQLFHGLADVASEDGEMAAMLAGSGVEDLGDLVQLGDIASDEGALSAYVDEVQGLADSDASDAELEDLVEG